MRKGNTKVANCGYGKLGRGVQKAIAKADDMELSILSTESILENSWTRHLERQIFEDNIKWRHIAYVDNRTEDI